MLEDKVVLEETAQDKNKWKIMFTVATGVFLATVDGSIVNVALPTLIRELNTSFSMVQWIVLAYLLTVASLTLSIGRLADIIGKKYLYLSGYITFTIGSALCGISQNIYFLIGARILQAIGAAMIMSLGTAIITETFPATERGKALGIIGSIVSLGIVSGPVIGGLILSNISWHWIFFVNVPIGIVGTFLVNKYILDTRPEKRQSFDFPGSILLFFGLISFLLGLTMNQNRILELSLLASAFLFLSSFVITELKTKEPILDMSLFKNVRFSINIVTAIFTFICASGSLVIIPFYLENILGYAPKSVGLFLGVVPIVIGITAPISGILVDKFGSKIVALTGLSFLLLGYFGISRLSASTTVFQYILTFIPIGLGNGLFQSPNNLSIINSSPKDRIGIVSSIISTARTIGQVTGVAVISSLWFKLTMYHENNYNLITVSQASKESQLYAMHNTFLFTCLLITLAICMTIYSYYREKKDINP